MKNLKKKLFSTIDEINEQVITIRQDLHAHPELSGHEEHTKYLVKGILEVSGYKVKESDEHFGLIADLVVDENAKTVAMRADMDALPIEEQTGKPYTSKEKGIMHACGHDSHTAIALGTAIAMAAHKDDLPGNRGLFKTATQTQ